MRTIYADDMLTSYDIARDAIKREDSMYRDDTPERYMFTKDELEAINKEAVGCRLRTKKKDGWRTDYKIYLTTIAFDDHDTVLINEIYDMAMFIHTTSSDLGISTTSALEIFVFILRVLRFASHVAFITE